MAVHAWGGAQCVNYGVPSGVGRELYVVTDIVAKGAYSGRFDLPAAGSSNSCELLRGRTIAMDDEWYSMEIRFPKDWQEPSPAGWGMSLAQFNFENIWGSPVSLIAHADYVDLTLNAGLCTSLTSGNAACQFSSGIGGNLPRQQVIPTSAFSIDTWHELLIHIKWTNGTDGILEGFHRLRGEATWTKTSRSQRLSDPPAHGDIYTGGIGPYGGQDRRLPGMGELPALRLAGQLLPGDVEQLR